MIKPLARNLFKLFIYIQHDFNLESTIPQAKSYNFFLGGGGLDLKSQYICWDPKLQSIASEISSLIPALPGTKEQIQ